MKPEIKNYCLQCGVDLTIYRMKKDYRLKTNFCDTECKVRYHKESVAQIKTDPERWAIIGINSSMEAMEEVAEMYK